MVVPQYRPGGCGGCQLMRTTKQAGWDHMHICHAAHDCTASHASEQAMVQIAALRRP